MCKNVSVVPVAIDYTKAETPVNYKCCECGATGCKLWRDKDSGDFNTLLCATCAAEFQQKDISDIDAKGTHKCSFSPQRTDSIGWYLPAVPTETGDNFWGYGSVPANACAWWDRLPTLPK